MQGGQTFFSGSKRGVESEPREEFKDTDGGKRVYGCFVAFYGASNDNDNDILPSNVIYIVAI